MTDKLVERARAIDPLCATQCCVNSDLYGDMADHIETLRAELSETKKEVTDMETRALEAEAQRSADAEVIKAAKVLAVGYGSLIKQVDRLQKFDLNADREILDDFRQAQARAEKGGE